MISSTFQERVGERRKLESIDHRKGNYMLSAIHLEAFLGFNQIPKRPHVRFDDAGGGQANEERREFWDNMRDN